jgi:hypothetical protein
MSELNRLREEHARLAMLFQRLGDAIGRATPPPQIELFELRRELASMLIAHLKLEDWALYPPLIGSGEAELASAGQAFKDEMGGLAPAFLAYCEKWSANTINADWNGYREDTHRILEALTTRLARENRELLPLLERLDHAA